MVIKEDGTKYINGAPASDDNQLRQVSHMSSSPARHDTDGGAVNPFKFLALIGDPETTINLWKTAAFKDGEDKVSVYYSVPVSGDTVVRPGQIVQARRLGAGPDRLRLPDDRPVPGHGRSAAHPHPLLHGAQPESGP